MPQAINFKFHGHIPYPLGMNPVENGHCWIAEMVAILDLMRSLYLPIGTKRLEILTQHEAKFPWLLWATNIMSYIDFQMVTLNLTFGSLSRLKWPKSTKNGS